MIEIMPSVLISPRARVGSGVLFGRNVRVWGPTTIGDRTIVEDNVQVGHPGPVDLAHVIQVSGPREGIASIDLLDDAATAPTVVGHESILRSGTVLYNGVTTGVGFDCAHNVIVREGCSFGDSCYVRVGTSIMRDVVVGDNARLGGIICDRSHLGNNVSSLGCLVHTYGSGQGGITEPAPTIHDGVVVGRGALVIGPVTLGRGCYIGAGAIVTKDIPQNARVIGARGQISENLSPVKYTDQLSGRPGAKTKGGKE